MHAETMMPQDPPLAALRESLRVICLLFPFLLTRLQVSCDEYAIYSSHTEASMHMEKAKLFAG